MASNCNSDIEDEYENSYSKKKYKKITYEDIENSLSKYYDENEKVGTETDVLITYLKGVQLLYKQSKNITQLKFYLLVMSTLSITICLSIISPFVQNMEWGAYLITAGNALTAILIAISRYLRFETYITNYAFMHRQYNRLENMLDFEHSREIFSSNQLDSTQIVSIDMNSAVPFYKGINLQDAEQRMNEMKEFERLQSLMVSALMNETKMKKEEIDKLMKAGHDFFLTPEQAIHMGIVDKIIGDKK
jgi:hypothetical protein